jgi:hypothetical protein
MQKAYGSPFDDVLGSVREPLLVLDANLTNARKIHQKPSDAQQILLTIEAVRGKGVSYDEDIVNLS